MPVPGKKRNTRQGKPSQAKQTKTVVKNDSNGANNRKTLREYAYIPGSDRYIAAASLPSGYQEQVEATNETINEYHLLRSKEFAQTYAYNLAEYSQELVAAKKKGRKSAQLGAWGIQNKGLYCAELTDKIMDETIQETGFSEYGKFTECKNRNHCPTVAATFQKRCKQKGIIGGFCDIRSTVKQNQANGDPYACYVAIVDSVGNVSGSGLHQVIIAPKLDKGGNVVMGQDGSPKMAVYSFNNERITDLESYKGVGCIYSITDYAKSQIYEEINKDPQKLKEIEQYVRDQKRSLPSKFNMNSPVASLLVSKREGHSMG